MYLGSIVGVHVLFDHVVYCYHAHESTRVRAQDRVNRMLSVSPHPVTLALQFVQPLNTCSLTTSGLIHLFRPYISEQRELCPVLVFVGSYAREILQSQVRGLVRCYSGMLRALLHHHMRAPAKIVRLIRILAAREHAISQLSTAAFAPRIGLT